MTNRRDLRLLWIAAFLRAVATGATGILSGIYLARLGIDAVQAGLIAGAGLGGATVAALVATLYGDRLGRRRFLLVAGALGGAGTALFATTQHAWPLALAAFAGMVNTMGRDRGAALILEQAMLPATVDDAGRTKAFALYNVLQDCGHALGSLLAGAPALIALALGLGMPDAVRVALAIAALFMIVSGVLAANLSPVTETAVVPRAQVPPVTPETRRLLVRLSALFAVDALGGGFLTAALLSWFFFKRFGVDEAQLGWLFFGARILNALSHLGAAWLAKRIGLVKTMVFTHIPSSLLLVTVAFSPDFRTAAILFLLREGLVEMDVPTRQSFVMAVVKPQERTLASGVTHLVRLAAWAVGPPIAGLVMGGFGLGAPLAIAATMKISYDLLLWRAFRGVRPPEEQR